MLNLLRVGSMLLILGSLGCSRPHESASEPCDPKAAEALLDHWAALQRRDWRAAYNQLHPDLKKAGATLKGFATLYSRRKGPEGFPQDIRIKGSEWVSDDVVVTISVLYASPGATESVEVLPHRKVTMRRWGASWGLASHDILAVGPGGDSW